MADFEPKQFGKYYLLEKLAVGGMAEIYKAKTYGVDGFEKLNVVKRILPHCSADREFITMLIDEAKLSVTLSHANIVQVFDLGKVGDDYFISMECINGVNLREIIYRCKDKNVKIPDELAAYIISEVCKGLDYAHRKTDASGDPLGIVHRDVSPQNILISYEGEVKIVDFGIAKAAMNISHTMAGILKGKIAYMSPEQALGKSVDYHTDLFSTGIVLFEMLTLEKLYTGESQFEVLKKIRSTKLDINKFPSSIPEGLRAVLAKALAFYVKDRYQSAGDMQIDLTRYLYTTHVDFTPKKLAEFVIELFKDDIAKQRERNMLEKAMEIQTSSINIAEEALQENIVHREESSPTIQAPVPKEAELTSADNTERTSAGKKEPAWKKFVFGAAVSAVLMAGGALAYFKFIAPQLSTEPSVQTELSVPPEADFLPPAEEPSPAAIAETGTLQLVTEPAGASVFLDMRPTGLETPSTLEGLELNKEFKITFIKDGFKDVSQAITLSSTKPQQFSAQLEPAEELASVVVKSNPEGATILLNGRDTGLKTPATLNEIPVGSLQNLTVSKIGYDSFTQNLTLKDTNPTEVIAVLSKTTSAQQLAEAQKAAEEKQKLEAAKQLEEQKKQELKKAEQKKAEQAAKKLETPTAPAPAKPVERPKPVEKPSKPESPVPAKAEKAAEPIQTTGEPASIRIASDPSGADIFINAEHRGTTPATISGIRPGQVSLLVNKEGRARISKKITLRSGEKLDLGTLKLGSLFGTLSIKSIPSGAKVYLDGNDIGARTPVSVKRVQTDKQHTIKLMLPGYRDWEKSFDMEGQDEKKFNVSLEEE